MGTALLFECTEANYVVISGDMFDLWFKLFIHVVLIEYKFQHCVNGENFVGNSQKFELTVFDSLVSDLCKKVSHDSKIKFVVHHSKLSYTILFATKYRWIYLHSENFFLQQVTSVCFQCIRCQIISVFTPNISSLHLCSYLSWIYLRKLHKYIYKFTTKLTLIYVHEKEKTSCEKSEIEIYHTWQ